MIEINAELLAAMMTLAATILGILFAKARDDKMLSNEQGDHLLAVARKAYDLAEVAFGGRPECREKLNDAKALMDLIEKAWNDSKVRTPEFEELVNALMKVIRELN